MGHLNIDLVFLKGGIFTVVAHVQVGNLPLSKSAVICDTVIFGAVPGSCQIFSNVQSGGVEKNGCVEETPAV